MKKAANESERTRQVSNLPESPRSRWQLSKEVESFIDCLAKLIAEERITEVEQAHVVEAQRKESSI